MTAQLSIAALRQRIAALSPAQQKLFRQQLEAKGLSWQQIISSENAESDDSISTTNKAPRSERLPLSAAQRQLWVTHQIQGDTSAYHIAIALQFSGDLNTEALRQSLQAIVNRHESLRTTFIEHDGQPFQQILPELILDIPVVDISRAEAVREELDQRSQTLVQTPFDLKTGPLVRAGLFQLEPHTTELMLVIHHIVADGWSRGILLKELAANYRNIVEKGSPVALPALDFQYADYVVQKQQQAATDDYRAHLQYWVKQLEGAERLVLPCDRVNSTDIDSHTLVHPLSPKQTDSVRQFARQSGVSLFMLLTAVFKLLMHRYSGQRDVVIGIPVAGREHPSVRSLIGFFVNTLVLRTQLTGVPTWHDWLQQIKSGLADALEHQSIPFSEVVDALDIARIPGQNPLFNVMFQVQSGYQLQNAEQLSLNLPGLSVSQGWAELTQTKFDMSWHIIERDDQLLVAVEYRTALFNDDRIQRLLSQFQVLIDSVLANPDAPISQLSILTADDRQQILASWSCSSLAHTLVDSFVQQFEQQVKKTPDAIAIKAKAQAVTYTELNQRANQLAHYLMSHGVKSETLVGICLPAGIDLIVALLGALKAGAAYVPLDPSLPKARLQFILRDAAPKALVTLRTTLDVAQFERDVLENVAVLTLDDQVAELEQQREKNLVIEISADHLAYVIYTSGSTGQPKGTLLTHGGLSNYLDWCLSAYPLTQGKGVPVHGSIGFDATITSLFAPLLTGQTLLFDLGETEIESIEAALALDTSIIKLTPAHLKALEPLLLARPESILGLPKALVIGGEALYPHHLSFWKEHFPEVTLFNEYGPTEAVVGCCVHQVTHGQNDAVPIGHPIPGTHLYVLDQYFEPVPVGVPGELYIGGVGVARGYLNRPDLTAERFIPNPFGSQADGFSTLYKTGDMACYRPDGALEYLGRRDGQIKLRGFRIELGEVEAALCQHPQVEQAVVVLSEKNHQQQSLIGYVVASDAESFDVLATELEQQLAQALPPYMVPSHLLPLDRLPLTVNGKVDRQALPIPNVLASGSVSVSPKTEREAILLEIWQAILGQTQVGTDDNFFNLGGDSISAMQIVAKARQRGLHLTPAQLFQHQTLAEQAAVAVEKSSQIETEPATGEAPLGPIQQDFFAQGLPQPHHYNQSVMLSVDANTNVKAVEIVLQRLVQHHDALRLRFGQTAGVWTQRYAAVDSVQVPLDVLDLTAGRQDLDEVVSTLQASLNLSQGPLFRGALLRLDAGYRLLLVAHHLVVDGVSWRILLQDLVTLYGQISADQPLSLPPRTTAFGQWTHHLLKQSFKAERGTWEAICRPVSALPVDDESGQNTVADRAEVLVSLGSQQLEQLGALESRLDIILLTGLAQTLTQWSRCDTTTIDIEGHGRHVWDDSLDLSRTVGWFTALFPVRLLFSPGSPRTQLSDVEAQLQQIPNRGVGYSVLRSKYLSSKDSAQTLESPAEVSFNYLGQLDFETDQGPIRGLAPESLVAMRGAGNPCQYQFEVVSFTCGSEKDGKQLQVCWRYSQQRYQRSTIAALAQRYLNNLLSLIAQPLAEQPVAQQANRFSASQVDTQQLNQLMKKLKTKGRA
ncbi:MAG: amino acid adenylation domain-containing protein [Cyanobacteria bacterium J06629_9]